MTADYILTVVVYKDDEGAPADHVTSHMTSAAVVYVTGSDESGLSTQMTITTLEDDHIAKVSVCNFFLALSHKSDPVYNFLPMHW